MMADAVAKYLFPFKVGLKFFGCVNFITIIHFKKTGKKSALRLKIMPNTHTREFSKTYIHDFEVLLFLLHKNDIVYHCKSTTTGTK